MPAPGVPHSPDDGAPQGQDDADLFRDAIPPASRPPVAQRPTWAAPVRPAAGASADLDPHAHDDLIGFTSQASLTGATRRRPELEMSPEPVPPEALIPPLPEREEPPIVAPVFAAPRARSAAVPPQAQATPDVSVESAAQFGLGPLKPAPIERAALNSGPLNPAPLNPAPVFSMSSEGPSFGRSGATQGGRNGREEAPEGAVGLYTIYALILFAVPTFGVAALIGLLMVWMRPKPEQRLARSHFEFQTRTLWIAAIAAVVGAVLIAVNLGVFVLVAMAVWVIVRGAWGVMTLAAGKPVSNPRTWMI